MCTPDIVVAMVQAPRPQPRDRRWSLFVVTAAWGSLIVGTSSTVILPHDFLLWFGSHVFTSESAYSQFVTFWGISWFTIVKGWHAVEFAVVCLLTLALFQRIRTGGTRTNVVLAMAISGLFAMSDEYHQTFIPDRGGTWTDVGIDSLGILVVGLISLQRLERPGRVAVESRLLKPANAAGHHD